MGEVHVCLLTRASKTKLKRSVCVQNKSTEGVLVNLPFVTFGIFQLQNWLWKTVCFQRGHLFQKCPGYFRIPTLCLRSSFAGLLLDWTRRRRATKQPLCFLNGLPCIA
ncbi:unnamed protein product [Rangifer tarandus platyrhynchus]|uniref:Uncharacterized protein n=1 Tax=Rangifer tarandus platyrhynchus TaxID=3082113 RepID=A0AC59Z8T5_RANTA